MGDVYRAVRDDDHFEKVVALKLVRTDVSTEVVHKRLRTERQILAPAWSIQASRGCSTAAPRRTAARSW
jgi:hypothetical protein